MLRVIEMCDGVTGQGGVGRRAAMGVKLVRTLSPLSLIFPFPSFIPYVLLWRLTPLLCDQKCIPRLSQPNPPASSSSDDKALKPQKKNEVDLLVSKLVLDAYANTPGSVGVDVVRKWIGGTA